MIRVADIAAHRQPEELAHKVIFETRANDLPLIVKIFRTDEADNTVHQERIKRTRNGVRTRFQSQLIDSMMSSGGECASLPRFKIHDIRAPPVHVSLAMMFENLLAAFAQHFQCDAETAIRGFSAGDGLKKQIHGGSAGEGSKLRCDVRETASLRWNLVGIHETCQAVEDRADCLYRIRGGVHTDHRVATSIKQPLKCSEQDSTDIVGGMIGLDANAQHSALAYGIPAARYVPDLRRGQNQIFVAHDLGHGRDNFGSERPMELFQARFADRIVEDVFAELSDGHALYGRKAFLVESVKDQAGDVVGVRIDQRLLDNFGESQIRELALGCDAFAFRPRGDARQVIPGLLLIGLGEKFAEIGKGKSLEHTIVRADGNARPWCRLASI